MRKDDNFTQKNNRVKKRFMQLTVCLFVGAILLVGLIGLILPLRPTTSDVEKRELEKFPTPTLTSLADGEFFSGVSTWYADTFPFREWLSSVNSKLHSYYGLGGEEIYGDMVQADAIPDADESTPAEGTVAATATPTPEITPIPTPTPGEDGTIHAEPERIGQIYIADNCGFEIFGFNRQGTDDYTTMVNYAASQLNGIATVYDIIVPTSIGVMLDEENQAKIGSSSQKETIDYAYSRLDPSVVQVPVFDLLVQHNSEYLYFKTDHHWTADGAYYAYQQLMITKGVQPAALDTYTKGEYPGFLGTFYSYSDQSETLKNNPDTLTTYTPTCNDMVYYDTDGTEHNWFVVADPTDYSAPNKYMAFISGDQPYSRIENPNITDGSSCVVIKESYGNAFVPFLVNSYQTVHVIDYRYYTGSLIDLVKQNGIQDVIYLNNTNALLESSSATMMGILYTNNPEMTAAATPMPTATETPAAAAATATETPADTATTTTPAATETATETQTEEEKEATEELEAGETVPGGRLKTMIDWLTQKE